MIFDLDDTLYLERDYVRSGFDAVATVLEPLGVTDAAAQLWDAFEQGVRGTSFDDLLERHGLRGRVPVDALVRRYREHAPRIALEPDARAMLDALSADFVGLVTDGPPASQRAKLLALDLERHLDHAIVTGEYGSGFSKPHPRAFEEMERVSGLAGDALVYVADNPGKDFDAPRALGWRSVRVRRAFGIYRALPGVEGVPEIEDLARLPELL